MCVLFGICGDFKVSELISRTDNRRMNVDRKLTFFTVCHEIHRLFQLCSLVNQDVRTESCTACHRVHMLLCNWMDRNMHRNYTFSCQKPIHDRRPFCDFEACMYEFCNLDNASVAVEV